MTAKARPLLDCIKEAAAAVQEAELSYEYWPSALSAIRMIEANDTLSRLNEITKNLMIDDEGNVFNRSLNKRKRNRNVTVLKNNEK